MKKIINRFFPFKGFTALTIFPFIFIRKENVGNYTWVFDNHEHIHGHQQCEVLVVACVLLAPLVYFFGIWGLLILPLFYYIYGIEWLVKFIYYRNAETAYKNVSFEREAYDNQNVMIYCPNRKFFAWIDYIKT